jgi:hypothetical protein
MSNQPFFVVDWGVMDILETKRGQDRDMMDEHFDFIDTLLNVERIGFGSLTYPQVLNVWIARNVLFQKIAYIMPEVVDELHELLTPYGQAEEAMSQWHVSRTGRDTQWFGWAAVVEAAIDHESVRPLWQAIRNWSGKYHLGDLWILENAVLTLSAWYQRPELADQRIWYYIGSKAMGTENYLDLADLALIAGPLRAVESLSPQPPRYNPAFQTKEGFKEAVRQYMNQVEGIYMDHGFVKSKHLRDRGGGRSVHFDWLAEYQVSLMSYEDIAQDYMDYDPAAKRSITPEAVQKLVEPLAMSIGLTLRS